MKNVFIFLLIVICVVLAWLYLTKKPPASPIEKAAKETVRIDAERLTRKSDSLGREHAILDETAHAISQAGLAVATDSTLINTVDSLIRLIGIERRHFRSYVQAQTRTVDSLMKATRTPTGYAYSDKWVSMALKHPTATDSAMFSFSYNAEVNMLQYWKRKHFLAQKRPYLDIWLSDPRAKINGVKRLVVQPKPNAVGFSVQAVGDYSGRGEVSMGVGATLRAGRVRLQGAYLNDMRGQWRPAFRGSYDLIDW